MHADEPTCEMPRVPPPHIVAEREDLLAPGQLLEGHYRIDTRLGSGGMAQVYLAYDHWLGRQVAVKISWPNTVAYLMREAQVLGSFHHRGLVTAHAYGWHEGLPYLVLEHLRGGSLSQRLHEREEHNLGPFSIDESLAIAVSVCEALAPLHARGLVHCDLKPGNIMCTPDRVVLIDLGVVRSNQAVLTDGSGSPPFMAPEVIRKCVHAGRGHLADIYALGMVLYTLLAGTPPFDDADPAIVMRRQLAEPAPPLASRRADLPPRLSGLVAAMLSRTPSQRPSDVTRLLAALSGIPRGCRHARIAR